ncbi:pirin family protein [Nostoc sp. UIC 10630]|uniref:pirin family protein n=1 Tax=Nostoc sp. UIC 10630 TaxID=2100146 RepID=UPI001FB0771F|nr:pirin family protein [Nostoc sp. UIC 10630]
MTVPTQTSRTVAGVINSVETLEGAGFLVRRPFPKSSFSEFDPFLLLDELGPINLKPGQAKGAPDHPHRGFETVSYVLDGRLEHKDSAGHAGLLNPGDVQWMTAGAGIVHSEMPESMFTQTGGVPWHSTMGQSATTRQNDATPLSGNSSGSHSGSSNRR